MVQCPFLGNEGPELSGFGAVRYYYRALGVRLKLKCVLSVSSYGGSDYEAGLGDMMARRYLRLGNRICQSSNNMEADIY